MPSILESLTKVLGQGGTLAKLGTLIEGDADQASEGVAAAGPALLGALAENAATEEGAEPIADLVDSVGPSILDDVDGFLDKDETDLGDGVLEALFGDDRSELLGGLSSEGSLGSSGYAKLLPRLAPLILGAVAKRKADDDLDVAGLAAALTAERGELEADGNLGEWFGRMLAGGGAIGALAGVAALAKGNDGGGHDDGADKEDVADHAGRKRPGWFWWAVGAVVLVLVAAWLISRNGDDGDDDGSTSTTTATTTAVETETDEGGPSDEDGGVDEDGAPSDADIGDAVRAALADAGFADSISGSVSDGVVTLTGSVGSDVDLDALTATIGGLDGVTEVENEIVVDEGSGAEAVSDDDLAAAVEAELAAAGFGDSVTVTVSDGVVTLTGTVESAVDVDVVSDTIEGIAGIGEIVNQVTVADDGSDADDDAPEEAGTSLNEQLGLAPVTFDYRSATVSAEGEAVLGEVVAYLEANDGDVTIEGHTDTDGTVAENVALGQRRADAVAAFLEAAGIDGDRLEAVGIGETEPKEPNDTADGKAANRRIEFVVSG